MSHAVQNLSQRLIADHLLEGDLTPGREIALKIDQTLTQDATGTLVMLELEAMGLDRVQTRLSAQYVDHNLLQTDARNADDHLFLLSACRRFGLWFSRPGNGVSHPVHMQRFGRPGETLLGADSHSCAAGSLGMLAMGAGGIEVAAAMAGEPFYLTMPEIFGVRLTGALPPWISAKDVILEMLRRHGVSGGVGRIIEYHGPGLDALSAMDRHVIANMGAELGATSSVFPADQAVRHFLRRQGREDEFQALDGGSDPAFDLEDEIDLSSLEPLIAKPGSPGNVVPVREVAGEPIHQAYIGSSANPGLRDFAVPALMLKGRKLPPQLSLDLNPTSRQLLEELIDLDLLDPLLQAGARLHQSGCNGCIGMGQAPGSGRVSLRTVPRNFPGRSGTRDDRVYLCSPETAAASALRGEITDPRDLEFEPVVFTEPETDAPDSGLLVEPETGEERAELVKGPNIKPLPQFEPLPDEFEGPVLIKLGDDVSTDEIMPAGSRVLPFRSNIPAISEFVFEAVDEGYAERALEYQDSGSLIVAGKNYGQGSSREHAALAPRFLGVRAVLARSFARIHWQNLVNFGILPLEFEDASAYESIEPGDELELRGLRAALQEGQATLPVRNRSRDEEYALTHRLSDRQLELVLCGGLINFLGKRSG